jgi:hypothetical protein
MGRQAAKSRSLLSPKKGVTMARFNGRRGILFPVGLSFVLILELCVLYWGGRNATAQEGMNWVCVGAPPFAQCDSCQITSNQTSCNTTVVPGWIYGACDTQSGVFCSLGEGSCGNVLWDCNVPPNVLQAGGPNNPCQLILSLCR